MGHKSRFMFPVPGQKAKELPARPINPASLSKARKILGTDKIDIEPPTFQGDSSKQWDTRSGISISVSESSTSLTTLDSNLKIGSEEEDGGAVEPSYGQAGWDDESDVIPRQTDSSNDLRGQKSTATIEHDFRTDTSSIQRRRSNASTIQTHYDRTKVPLSVSQQTSNSAMAKGLPTKVHAVLGLDRTPSGPVKKKRPSMLDFSLLRPRSRKGQDATAPVLGNSYVMRSPSLMSQMSAMIKTPSLREKGHSSSRRSTQSTREAAGTPRTSQAYLPKGATEADGLRHLYDHYEQMTLGEEPSSPELEASNPPGFGPSTAEPTPPLTMASTLVTPTTTPASPVSKPVIRESKVYSTHSRRDSNGSRNTVTTARSSVPYPLHLSPGNDYASSISSRQTRTSRLSQSNRSIHDANLQQSSVLSLSDSESEDGGFSDSAPKSSMSSHGDASHDDMTAKAELRKSAIEPPVIQERVSSKKRLSEYAQLNDFLAIPKLNIKPQNTHMASNSTLRTSLSSASTTTPSADAASPASKRTSSLSVLSNDSGRPISSATYDSAYSERRRTGYGIQEAKAVALTPLASSAQALVSSPATPKSMECTGSEDEPRDHPQLNEQPRRNSDQLTPPLSPKTLDFFVRPPESPSTGSVTSLDGDGLNARFMAVTRQEEMLLAALRKKRATMRENIIAELEVGRNSVSSHRTTSSSGGSNDGAKRHRKSDAATRLLETPAPHGSQFPSRYSSLSIGVKDLTERKTGTPFPRDSKFDHMMQSPDVPLPLIPSRSGPAQRHDISPLNSNNASQANVSEEDHQVLRYLNSPLSSIDAIETLEPSPDIGDFMDFMNDSDGEIPLELRQSRSMSKSSICEDVPVPYDGRRGSERSRANSAVFAAHRSHLENLPEWTGEEQLNDDGEYYFDYDFDELSDSVEHTSVGNGIARPDSPVSELLGQMLNRKRIQANTALRISAVGPMMKQPFEVGLWGNNG